MLDLTREKPLRIAQVQKIFGVGREVVDAWLSRGLEHVKVGGIVFTSREAVLRHGEPPPPEKAAEPPKPNENAGDGAKAVLGQILSDFESQRKNPGGNRGGK
jgi:hypothetical protein